MARLLIAIRKFVCALVVFFDQPQPDSEESVLAQTRAENNVVTMGRERQKKKNRSSISKVRPNSNRTKAGKKKVNFLGNATIAQNWFVQTDHPSHGRGLTISQGSKAYRIAKL